MVALGSLLGMGRGNQQKAVLGTLRSLDKSRKTVRLEVEHLNVRFNTVLALRRDTVIFAKPPALHNDLQKGHFVRFRVPDQPTQELRMEVVLADFTLTNSQPVFLCKPPDGFAEASRRSSDRLDTRRFNNLHLHLPGHSEPLRIVNISESGCRVATQHPDPRKLFSPEQTAGAARVTLGKKAEIRLSAIVPRNFGKGQVGFAFTLGVESSDRKLLQHLLKSLDKVQAEHYKAEVL